MMVVFDRWNNTSSEVIFDMLKPIDCGRREIVVERISVVKLDRNESVGKDNSRI